MVSRRCLPCAVGEARLLAPLRSEGGRRRHSSYRLRIAAHVRELVISGTPADAACRIVILEDRLEEALRLNAELRRPRPAAEYLHWPAQNITQWTTVILCLRPE
ncbi:hypothetical protein ACTU45_01865 [Streptomyces sp. 24-1644]|uniref:hypothetical protein n=1 Tax=Streptomyces sp. 24-1644 TaxID=3457315 RepID=UPI003FA68FDA